MLGGASAPAVVQSSTTSKTARRAARTGGDQQPSWRRAFITSTLVLGLFSTGLLTAPAMLTQTPLRSQVLQSLLAHGGLTAVALHAHGGWLQPVTFEGIELRDAQGQVFCRIREIRTSGGLLSFISGDGPPRQLTIVEPDVDICLRDDGSWPLNSSTSSGLGLDCEFIIQDLSLRIRVPERELPIVDLQSLDITGRVAREQSGDRYLSVDAFQVLDRQRLSAEQSRQNLALIAPVLSQSTQISGTASAWIDPIRVSLDVAREPGRLVPVSGRVEFHELHAQLQPQWARQLALLTGQLTAVQLPSRLEIARESSVEFSVGADGIHHCGLLLLLPDVAVDLSVASQGTVGLDKSLDIFLSIDVPAAARAAQGAGQRDAATVWLGRLLNKPLQLHVTGTTAAPVVGTPAGRSLLDEIAWRMSPEQYTERSPSVSQAVFELVRGAAQENQQDVQRDLPGGILNLIRAVKADKAARKQTADPGAQDD